MPEDKESKEESEEVKAKSGNRNKKNHANNGQKSHSEASSKVEEPKKDVTEPLGEPVSLAEIIAKPSSEVDLSQFISNPDGPIYAITNLPEEFIATLFAWVSRSDKSFKEHLKRALEGNEIALASEGNPFKELDEKARKFHEKWTVGYGHSSVAEHAVAHVGIEGVSRLASAELELSNQFLSITEYSQRYQRPKRGDWYNPFDKKDKLHDKYEAFMSKSFDAFEELIDKLKTFLVNRETRNGQKLSDSRLSQLEKLAFEDARYVLPLSMKTQLGMTANGRAWRDGLAVLGNSTHKEIHDMSDSIRTEITKVLPVLLKYATPSQYQVNAKKRMATHFKGDTLIREERTPNVRITSIESEESALNKIIASFMFEHEPIPYAVALSWVKEMPAERKQQIFRDAIHEMKHFDNPPEAFKQVNYQVEYNVSEANWHQLLRHNRVTDFSWSRPSISFGHTTPPAISFSGNEELFEDIIQASEELFNEISKTNEPENAQYVVTNAHHRNIISNFTLWEAYHLINLRTSDEAQWDIRETFEQLFSLLRNLHPTLVQAAQRRN